MTWRIGIDIGGTFTDVALVEEASGRIGVAKVPTTPADPAEGVLRALATAMARYAVSAADVGLLSHATTVVTNAILEEKGARAALVTTRGFRDVLELRRSSRPDLYDLFRTRRQCLFRGAGGTRSASASAPTAAWFWRSPRLRLATSLPGCAPIGWRPSPCRCCSAFSIRSTRLGSGVACGRRSRT